MLPSCHTSCAPPSRVKACCPYWHPPPRLVPPLSHSQWAEQELRLRRRRGSPAKPPPGAPARLCSAEQQHRRGQGVRVRGGVESTELKTSRLNTCRRANEAEHTNYVSLLQREWWKGFHSYSPTCYTGTGPGATAPRMDYVLANSVAFMAFVNLTRVRKFAGCPLSFRSRCPTERSPNHLTWPEENALANSCGEAHPSRWTAHCTYGRWMDELWALYFKTSKSYLQTRRRGGCKLWAHISASAAPLYYFSLSWVTRLCCKLLLGPPGPVTGALFGLCASLRGAI